MKPIEIITHFGKDDKDCSCDYYSVDVKFEGKIVRHYSDHYHDKGAEKAESFVDGVLFAEGHNIDIEKPNKLIKRTHKADGKV